MNKYTNDCFDEQLPPNVALDDSDDEGTSFGGEVEGTNDAEVVSNVPTDDSDDEETRPRTNIEIPTDAEIVLRPSSEPESREETVVDIPDEDDGLTPNVLVIPSEEPVTDPLIVISGEGDIPELAPPPSEASDDFQREKGIIIMRNGEDKLYTLVPLLNPIDNTFKGPFVDRESQHRFFG